MEQSTLAKGAERARRAWTVEESLIAATAFVVWSFAMIAFTFYLDARNLFGPGVIITSMNIVSALRLTIRS